jgi:dihydroorotase
VLGIPAGTIEPGKAADLTLFDPEESWDVKPGVFHSKSTNSPYIGMTLRGRVKHTILDGDVVTTRIKKS